MPHVVNSADKNTQHATQPLFANGTRCRGSGVIVDLLKPVAVPHSDPVSLLRVWSNTDSQLAQFLLRSCNENAHLVEIRQLINVKHAQALQRRDDGECGMFDAIQGGDAAGRERLRGNNRGRN